MKNIFTISKALNLIVMMSLLFVLFGTNTVFAKSCRSISNDIDDHVEEYKNFDSALLDLTEQYYNDKEELKVPGMTKSMYEGLATNLYNRYVDEYNLMQIDQQRIAIEHDDLLDDYDDCLVVEAEEDRLDAEKTLLYLKQREKRS